MTTHARGSTAPKNPPFTRITNEQISIPKREHARGEPLGGGAVSKLEFAVLCALMKITFHGQDRCFATNLKIADEAGLTGRDDARRSQIHTALYGRAYRKGRWDPETGKWKRDGELVTLPGLCHPSRGFVEVRQAGPSAPRELVLTPRWLEWGRIRVFEGGIGKSTGAGPGPGGAPAIAGASTDVVAGDKFVDRVDEPTAPVGPPPPAAPETAGTETAAPIVRSATGATVEQPPPGVPDLVGTSDRPPTAPSPVEQPSAEVLAEVLGDHASEPRPDQAWQLDQRMRLRGVLWDLGDNDSLKYEVARGYDPLTGSEKSVIRWLKPELVALLKAEAEKSRPRPKPGEPPAGERPAPRVINPAEVRAMIGKLTARPADDDSDCRALARRLVTDPGFAHNDADPATSEATYFGLACDTKRGALGQVVITEAFEAARGPKVRNRGAMLVAVVKGLKAGMRKPDPDHEGGSTS